MATIQSVIYLLLLIGPLNTRSLGDEDDMQYTNHFAVKIEGGDDEAAAIATEYGYEIESKISLSDYGTVYKFVHSDVHHRSRRSADHHINILRSHPNVQYVEQQEILIRDKRHEKRHEIHSDEEADARDIVYDKQNELNFKVYKDKSVFQRVDVSKSNFDTRDGVERETINFKDPLFKDQWYLNDVGQAGGPAGMDMNVVKVWKNGYTGKGVTVCILDDGIQHEHQDLQKNYDPKASADFNDRKDKNNDPTPNTKIAGNNHGTRCAGEIAGEANNTVCGVGIAYDCNIGGVRILDGVVTDHLEAEALTFKNDYIDIYSASWGPRDNGKRMEGPKKFTAGALKDGVEKGRNGKGSLFVWATGNGGMHADDCGADGYVSSVYTISVGSINNYALSTYYSEQCPSTLCVVPTGGHHSSNPFNKEDQHPLLKVVTTDIDNDCTENFQGTSAAAPLAAGCLALVLQANANLTWRDIQYIITETARIPNAKESGWVVNGAGKHVNDKFGFGMMDCGQMVMKAQEWKSVSQQMICKSEEQIEDKPIASQSTVKVTMRSDGCQSDNDHRVDKLEHTEVHVQIDHTYRGDLQLTLVSPAGTRSEVLSLRRNDDATEGIHFTFMTVHNWGENPRGTWTLEVKDQPWGGRVNHGMVRRWSLIMYGISSHVPKSRSAETDHTAHNPSHSEVKDLMEKEQERAQDVRIKLLKDFVKKTLSTKHYQNEAREIIDLIESDQIPEDKLQYVMEDLTEDIKELLKRIEKDKSKKINESPGEANDLFNSNSEQYPKKDSQSDVNDFIDFMNGYIEKNPDFLQKRKHALDPMDPYKTKRVDEIYNYNEIDNKISDLSPESDSQNYDGTFSDKRGMKERGSRVNTIAKRLQMEYDLSDEELAEIERLITKIRKFV